MKSTWHRFLAPLTPGVRVLLCLLTVCYLVALGGVFSHAYNIYPLLGLAGPMFWHGKLWTILTYGLLPAGPLDFVFNWVMILVFGSWLERVWSRWQLWLYCGVCTVGAGLVKVFVQPSSLSLMVGTTPVVFGLLAAWGILFAGERVLFWFLWEMSIRQAAVVMALISFIVMLPCAGPVVAGIMLCGGVAGLLMLAFQSRVLHSQASRSVVSERMERLEL